jgi:Cu(I)-responsive transcriptional regulator
MATSATDASRMTIGRLAEQAGVGVQTVRYYERRGLLPAAPRRPSGYREYDGAALDRLRFIRRAQELGFTLAEIAELLALRLDPRTTAADVKARAGRKLESVAGKIRDLERIRDALTHLAGQCRGGRGPTGDCPLVEALGPLDLPSAPVRSGAARSTNHHQGKRS